MPRPKRCTTRRASRSEVPAERRLSARGIEVGHIFYFGTKYSAPMKAEVATADGKNIPVEMGSYGIGVSRLVGAIIEASHDDKGVIWPAAVAPFEVAVVSLRTDDADVTKVCESAYEQLQKAGVDVLYDDTAERPGAKFSTMELIGVPELIVVGPKGVKAGVVEYRNRKAGATEEMTLDAAIKRCLAATGRPDRMDAAKDQRVIERPFGPFERMLALRYLGAKREHGGLAFISIVSVIGITLGVWALILTMSIMNGFRLELISKIIGFEPHVFIDTRGAAAAAGRRDDGGAAQRPGVMSVEPLHEGTGLASAYGRSEGIQVRGVRPEDLRANKLIADSIAGGAERRTATATPNRCSAILAPPIGCRLA